MSCDKTIQLPQSEISKQDLVQLDKAGTHCLILKRIDSVALVCIGSGKVAVVLNSLTDWSAAIRLKSALLQANGLERAY